MGTHHEIGLSPNVVAQVDPAAAVDLLRGTQDILHEYGLPASITLDSDRSASTKWLRQFSATFAGVFDIYRVRVNLASDKDTFNGRPVVDFADFFASASDEQLTPDSIVTLKRAFGRWRGVVGEVEARRLIGPDRILQSLGQSVVLLSQGVNVSPDEYWEIADRA